MSQKWFLWNQCKRHNYQPGRKSEKLNVSIVYQLISHAWNRLFHSILAENAVCFRISRVTECTQILSNIRKNNANNTTLIMMNYHERKIAVLWIMRGNFVGIAIYCIMQYFQGWKCYLDTKKYWIVRDDENRIPIIENNFQDYE